MKKPCKLMNRYRDGELEPPLKAAFESHLATCVDCRRTLALLNNMVRLLKPAGPEAPPAFSERVARLAFEKANSWDVMVTTWIRPAPAWIALAFCALFSSVIWILPEPAQRPDAVTEYEVISSDPVVTTGIQIQTEDFSTWFEAGGVK